MIVPRTILGTLLGLDASNIVLYTVSKPYLFLLLPVCWHFSSCVANSVLYCLCISEYSVLGPVLTFIT